MNSFIIFPKATNQKFVAFLFASPLPREFIMSVPLAALCVIVIWSTTALAVKWSLDNVSFLSAVSLRMVVASLLCISIVLVMRCELPLHRRALALYAMTGLGLFCGLGGTYWAAQSLSSGLIAVGWGLWPLFTGIIAFYVLKERLGWHQGLGIAAAISGLWLTFADGHSLAPGSILALLVLLAVILIQSLSMVMLKRWGNGIPWFAATTGSIVVASVLFALSWLLFDRSIPQAISQRTLAAILYLASVGNLLGLGAYTYLAQHVPAGKATLVTLLTPVFALALGHYLNAEPVSARMLLGIALVVGGLLAYQRPWLWLKTNQA